MVNVIIVAAGSGTRFGSNLPKQFHRLATGMTVLDTAIAAFRCALPYARIIVVVSKGMENAVGAVDVDIVHGGDTRFASVSNALAKIDVRSGDIVLVHDGARPLVDAGTIDRVVGALKNAPAVVPAVAVTDSLRHVGEDGASTAVCRSEFRAVQTPQGFDGATLKSAYATGYREGFTDDASVVEASGVAVAIVEGNPSNIKITNPDDLALADIITGRPAFQDASKY